MALHTHELAARARAIEIASRRLVSEQLAAQYHSVFKGRGLVFSDVRAYVDGDDVRAIDWNITARMNAPHVKQFIEERDRTVHLVIDTSASGVFGSRGTTKRELAAELAAVIAFSAIENQDRVGLVIATDRVELYVPPKKGRRHVLRLIGEILAYGAGARAQSRRTDLAVGLDFLAKVTRRRSLVFLVSDFLTSGWERSLKICAQRNELVPVVVSDPLEAALPPIGLVAIEDLETGEVVEVQTRGRAGRALRERAAAAEATRDAALRRLDLDVLRVQTDQPYLAALVAFFRAHAQRRGRT